jgi:hypothetical protein
MDTTKDKAKQEREALRMLGRIVRELVDVCVGLEEENDTLRGQLIEFKGGERRESRESKMEGKKDGESVLELTISRDSDADTVGPEYSYIETNWKRF